MPYADPKRKREYNREWNESHPESRKASTEKWLKSQKRQESLRKYYQRPEVRERLREYQREYYYRPEVQKKIREYSQRPDVRAKSAERHRRWIKNNPDRKAVYVQKQREERRLNPQKFAADVRRWIVKRYGITVEQYNQMLKKQNDVCALCGQPPTKKKLSVDHDHTTGQIRGLLCHLCNIALGRVEARMSLARIEAYLKGAL